MLSFVRCIKTHLKDQGEECTYNEMLVETHLKISEILVIIWHEIEKILIGLFYDCDGY